MRTLFLLTGFVLLGASSCKPEVPVLPAELVYPNFAGELVVADLNNDGLDEIAAASGTNAFVFFGSSEKTFSLVSSSLNPITLRATLSAADLDGDGISELITTGTVLQDQSHFSQVFTAQGNALSSPQNQSLEGGIFASPYHVVGDFDGDGDGDLAVVQDTQLLIYAGDGSTFDATPAVLDVGRPILSRSLSAGDVDGDGLDDIAGCGPQGTVLVFGAAGPSVESPVFVSDIDQIKTRIVDLNNDGRPDVASIGRTSPDVLSFSFAADRSVTDIAPFSIGDSADVVGYIDFTAADLDNDGLNDVVGIRLEQGGDSLAVGISVQDNGTFAARPNLATPVNSQNAELEVGDLDSDDFIDIVISDNDRARIAASVGRGL
jgi:hypothetical protein